MSRNLKKDDLYLLIDALSPAEKKSLAIFFSTLPKRENTLYHYLFKKSKRERPASGLPDSLQAQAKAKRRTYDNILKSLRNHHDKKSAEILIQSMLCEVEILYDLCLPEQALLIWRKVYVLAGKFEKYGLLFPVFEWERKLNIVLDVPTRTNESIEKEEQRVLGKMNEILLFKSVFSKVKAIKKRYGYINHLPDRIGEIDRLLATLPALKIGASQKAFYYRYFTLTLYNWMLFNHTAAYKYSKMLLSEKVKQVLPNEYLEGILEHLTSCVCLAKFEEALSTMDLAERFIRLQKYDQSHSFLLRVFYFKIAYKLLIHYYMGDTEKLSRVLTETEEKLQHFDKQFSIEMKQVISSNMKVAYMAAGDMDKAEQIVEETLRVGPQVTRKDLYEDALLFRIFSLLQAQTYILLPSVALSAYRYYSHTESTEGKPYNVAYKIAGLLKKEHDYGNLAIRNKILLEIKEMLQAYIASIAGSNNFQESHTYFIIWVDSLIWERPFHEQAALWYADFNPAVTLPDHSYA